MEPYIDMGNVFPLLTAPIESPKCITLITCPFYDIGQNTTLKYESNELHRLPKPPANQRCGSDGNDKIP
jgi:hypothetical protein